MLLVVVAVVVMVVVNREWAVVVIGGAGATCSGDGLFFRRHRRHVYSAGMGVPVLKMTASPKSLVGATFGGGGVFQLSSVRHEGEKRVKRVGPYW